MKKTLGKKLKALRENKELSQQALVDEIKKSFKNAKIDKQRISTYEKNETIPSIETIFIFSQFFNVSMNYLYDDEASNDSWENIKINKELGLTDKAISKLKDLKEVRRWEDETNFFIQSEQFYTIISYTYQTRFFYSFYNVLDNWIDDYNFDSEYFERILYFIDEAEYYFQEFYEAHNTEFRDIKKIYEEIKGSKAPTKKITNECLQKFDGYVEKMKKLLMEQVELSESRINRATWEYIQELETKLKEQMKGDGNNVN